MVILVVSLAMFMELLDGTALNTSLPQIAKDFSLAPMDLSLVITAYLFALAVCIPLSAYFVEKLGIKKTLILAFCVFIVGSIGCGLSTSKELLVVCRLVQGIGGSFMLPVGRLCIATVFGKNIVSAMAIVTSISLTGPMIGPVLGGYLSTFLGWQWIFFINIPFSILAIILVIKSFPADKMELNASFDLIGFFMLFLGFGLLVLCSGSSMINNSIILKVVMFFVGFMMLALYFNHAKRSLKPLVNINVFQNNTFKNITIGNFLIRFAVGSFPFIIPAMLYQQHSLSSFDIGLSMLPFVFGTWLVKPFVTKLLAITSNRRLLIYNSTLLAIVQFCLIYFVAYFNSALFVLYGVVIGILNSIQFATMNSSMFLSLDGRDKAHGNAAYLSLSQLGSCLGVGLAASIYTLFNNFSLNGLVAYQCLIGILASVTFTSCIFFTKMPSDSDELLSPTSNV